jgi:hypothetical protein
MTATTATFAWKREGLRAVLFGFAVGHLVTATLFLFWPAYFLTGAGATPPWPLSMFQFGVWPPVHEGFMNVIAVYDVAVAFALLLAAWSPERHRGLISFAIVLWILHGGVHAYHILWGTSPGGFWGTVGALWLGALALLVLYPRRSHSA